MSETQLSYGNQYYDVFIYHFVVYLLMAMSKNIVITMGTFKEQCI